MWYRKNVGGAERWGRLLMGGVMALCGLFGLQASLLGLLLAAGGIYSALAPIPLLAIVALYALELLVAFLQAFVFSVLTCVYLNDAIHPGH